MGGRSGTLFPLAFLTCIKPEWTMLVFLSDVHLTDGSSGTTIVPQAFKKFCQILSDIIGDAKASHIDRIEIVLLGDIFDVIRSTLWLRPKNDDPKNPIRPWSAATEIDQDGWTVQRYTEEIIQRIIRENSSAIGYLRDFQTKCVGAGVEVVFSYFIGNHDWLINRYPATRREIAGFLGLPDPESYETKQYPLWQVFEKYRVMARHGDIYDHLNYEGDRNASSLGDAIVIDLVNKFPEAVKKDPHLGGDEDLVKKLKEIDNVRPLQDIPAWIQGVCKHHPGVEVRVHEIWEVLLDSFFQLKFVKDRAPWGLRMVLEIASGVTFGRLRKILGSQLCRKFFQNLDNYKAAAFNEKPLKENQVNYVVYGHTHYQDQVPLGFDGSTEKIYFNTGTWRKVFEHTVYDAESLEFIGWDVLTFIIFYLEEEKEKERNYEVWTASLGYGG
jgi:UDP-2,3-diacylglucosamine pyrophosphatase LpxH